MARTPTCQTAPMGRDSRDEEIERLRAVVSAIPDPIYRLTADGTFIDVEVPDDHPDAVDQSTIPGLTIRGVMPPRAAAVVTAGISVALDQQRVHTVEYDWVVDGERHWWEARLVPSGGEVLAIVRDITDRRRGETETLRAARTDMLTGLANRAWFLEALESALARSRRATTTVAVLYCDLDRFKAINDRFGHAVGDVVLGEVAARVTAELRDVDLAARLGGDEIGVLVESPESVDGLGNLGRRLIDAVTEPYQAGGRTHVVGLSVGIALHPGHADTSVALLAAADAAMYRAKSAGGSCVEIAAGSEKDPGATRPARPGPDPEGSG